MRKWDGEDVLIRQHKGVKYRKRMKESLIIVKMSEIDILTTYLKIKYIVNVNLYITVHTEFKRKIFIWADNSLSKSHRPHKRTPMPGTGLPLLNC